MHHLGQWYSDSNETTLEDIFEVRVKGTTIEYLIMLFIHLKILLHSHFTEIKYNKYGGVKNVQIYSHQKMYLKM